MSQIFTTVKDLKLESDIGKMDTESNEQYDKNYKGKALNFHVSV